MKIWYQSAARFDIDAKWQSYERSLKKHLSSLMAPTTTFSMQGIDSQFIDTGNPDALDAYRKQRFCENAQLAQSQGYDAFAIGCWKDYANSTIRRETRLLAVSIAEASLHASLILGRRPGLIMPNPRDEAIVKENLKIYGIDPSSILISTCHMDVRILLEAFVNSEPFFEAFMPYANEMIRRGADVIVVGYGVLNEVLYHVGLREIGNIPVLDSIVALLGTIQLLKK